MRCILGWDEDGGVTMGKDNVTVSMLDGMHPIELLYYHVNVLVVDGYSVDDTVKVAEFCCIYELSKYRQGSW